MNRFTLLLTAPLLASISPLLAQNAPPVVTTQLPDITEYAGAPSDSIDVSNAFSDPDVSDAVRFSTVLGDIDIALFGQQKPITVANFLKYVDQGRYFVTDPSTHQPASSFVHRSLPGFIIQGGAWIGTVNQFGTAIQPTLVSTLQPIQNEPGISNTRGTIAMAQVTGNPNSATSQWFINLADNGGPPNNLDVQTTTNGVTSGPYTVFGRVGNNTMGAVDAIAAVPVYDFSSMGASFKNLPLMNYTRGNPVLTGNLVSVPAINHIPVLSLSASTDNANVSVAFSGTKLLVAGKSVGTSHVTLTATDLDGASVSQQFTVTILNGPGRPVNLSTRMQVGTGDNALIAGFIMRGSAPKRLAVRALGFSSGLPNYLVNPTLELHNTSATIATNDDWQTAANKQDIIDIGLAPNSPTESVILTTVPSDPNGIAYTAVVRGAFNSTGLGVVEVYDLDSGPGSTLLNISTRGQVGTDPNALIGGFILGGTESKNILVRAIGPSLAAFGIANALSDPTLELRDGNGALVDSNNDWMNSPQKTDIQNSGLAPSNAKESAILHLLPAGGYTAIVRGTNSGTGIGSVEAYLLP
ncbi:MAG: peptidylprolyl isomerase [Chthoniobacterales bacterium]